MRKVTSGAEPDLMALLRTLAEQNQAMLAAHTESLKLQRLLIERLLGSEVAAAPKADSPPAAEPIEVPIPAEPEPVPEPEPEPEGAPEPYPEPRSRHPSPARAQASRPVRAWKEQGVGHRNLAVVKRLVDAEGSSGLVLLFGPYRGQALRWVAQVDPDYVLGLARTARAGEVRAAAARLARVLPRTSPAKSSALRRLG